MLSEDYLYAVALWEGLRPFQVPLLILGSHLASTTSLTLEEVQATVVRTT